MLRSQKMALICLFIAILVGGGLYALPAPATAAVHHPALRYSAYAAGPYRTSGNRILDATGQAYYFHGVARDGLEFSCADDPSLAPRYLALMGPQIAGLSGTFWYGNTVRLPVSELLWLYKQTQNGQSCTPARYQQLLKQTIDALTLLHLNVILDLQWSDAGGHGPGASWDLPDADSVTFWQQAAQVYGSYSNVLFELYNEPHIWLADTTALWNCWRSGCQVVNDASAQGACGCQKLFSYQGVGMQTLVSAVRQVGAQNLLLVGGVNWSYELSGLKNAPLMGINLVYDTHPYPYAGKDTVSAWDKSFGQLSQIYPVIAAESGEYDCKASFLSQLVPYFDAHQMSWIGWSWFAGANPCGFPELIDDYNGTPAPLMGSFVYRTLLAYADVTPQTGFSPFNPGTGPVDQEWYFPGEPVGGGFTQTLILDDASSYSCDVTVSYLLRSQQNATSVKTAKLHMAALDQLTVQVNSDVGVVSTAPVVQVGTIVSARGTRCTGIVVERTIQVAIPGLVENGSTLSGLTSASTTFAFADISTGDQADAALAALNPGSLQAHVTVSYFAAGRQVGQQQLNLAPLTTNSFRPPAGLPAHSEALLTSDQPVVAAYSLLLIHFNAGKVGAVTGFAEVVGTTQTAPGWLFAEGSSAPGFQTNLVLANFTAATAHATITLDYANGTHETLQTNIAAHSQSTWDVNAHVAASTHATTNVALAVQADTALAVVRNVYFRHGQLTGLTSANGALTSAATSAQTFADSSLASSTDAWLTLLNPTVQRELLTLILVRGGQTITYQVYLPAQSRGTIWLTRLASGLGWPLDGAASALTVSSNGGVFVAERVSYWQTASTQGASAVAGYGGHS